MGDLLDNLRDHGILTIVDAPVRERLVEWAMAAAKGGVHLIGVPASLTGVTEAIDELGDEAHLTIGITGVTQEAELSVAVAAGADFVISPIAEAALIEAAHTRGLEVVAGAMTLTEIAAAAAAGADLIAVHPVGVLGGPDYFREVARTFRGAPLLASGGVDVEGAAAYLELGALGALVDRGVFPAPDEPAALEVITARALALVEVAADAMGTPNRVSMTDVLREAGIERSVSELDLGVDGDLGAEPLDGALFDDATEGAPPPPPPQPPGAPADLAGLEDDFELLNDSLDAEG